LNLWNALLSEEELRMAPMATKISTWLACLAALFLAGLTACGGPHARSERSFPEIAKLVRGKTAEQVAGLLGEPDTRQPVFDAGERWIWWNYTFLDGSDFPPEKRGRVVHLEIVVRSPTTESTSRPSYAEWQVDDTFGITYRDPSQNDRTEG
jgi:hypothetical protein